MTLLGWLVLLWAIFYANLKRGQVNSLESSNRALRQQREYSLSTHQKQVRLAESRALTIEQQAAKIDELNETSDQLREIHLADNLANGAQIRRLEGELKAKDSALESLIGDLNKEVRYKDNYRILWESEVERRKESERALKKLKATLRKRKSQAKYKKLKETQTNSKSLKARKASHG